MLLDSENVANISNDSLDLIYSFDGSLSFQSLSTTPAKQIQEDLLSQELSFLYSTQYLAEQNGEVALEHMRERTYQPTKQNKILDMQIKDELTHVQMLKSIVDSVGLDTRASQFAEGYTRILYAAPTLAEKVFIFQIMTEAVSSAYLKWRLLKIQSTKANAIDQEIFNDEVRHLKMGRSLLEMCDQDELKNILTAERRRTLVREMSNMCSEHFFGGISRIISDHNLAENFKKCTTDLDKLVARTILFETKSASEIIEGVQ